MFSYVPPLTCCLFYILLSSVFEYDFPFFRLCDSGVYVSLGSIYIMLGLYVFMLLNCCCELDTSFLQSLPFSYILCCTAVSFYVQLSSFKSVLSLFPFSCFLFPSVLTSFLLFLPQFSSIPSILLFFSVHFLFYFFRTCIFWLLLSCLPFLSSSPLIFSFSYLSFFLINFSCHFISYDLFVLYYLYIHLFSYFICLFILFICVFHLFIYFIYLLTYFYLISFIDFSCHFISFYHISLASPFHPCTFCWFIFLLHVSL